MTYKDNGSYESSPPCSRTHKRLPHFLKSIYTPHIYVCIYTQPLRVAPQGSDMLGRLTECRYTFSYIYIPYMYIYIYTQPLRVAPQAGDMIVGLTESCHTSSLIEAVWDICVSSRHEPQGKGGGVSHVWMSHVTQMKESLHTHERVVTQMNESLHTQDWVIYYSTPNHGHAVACDYGCARTHTHAHTHTHTHAHARSHTHIT